MWQVRVVIFTPEDIPVLLNERTLDLVDAQSREKLERFYHKEDSLRGLIGRLLPRVLLWERGIACDGATFQVTAEGKPYIVLADTHEPVAYNITHDNSMVAMVFSCGDDLYSDPPAYRLGIDVMRVQLPRRNTLAGFIEIFEGQLTELEHRVLRHLPPLPDSEILRRFYLIWTLKEAYTKALGQGLGFDFQRIEYNVPEETVRIDGVIPAGWEFIRFEVETKEGEEPCTYVGVAVRYVGEEVDRQVGGVVHARNPGEWLQVQNAASFMHATLRALE